MATSVKMSSKNQIVVPKEARDALALRAGDRLLVSVIPDGVVRLEREPRDYGAELAGLFRALGGGEDAGDPRLWSELAGEEGGRR